MERRFIRSLLCRPSISVLSISFCLTLVKVGSKAASQVRASNPNIVAWSAQVIGEVFNEPVTLGSEPSVDLFLLAITSQVRGVHGQSAIAWNLHIFYARLSTHGRQIRVAGHMLGCWDRCHCCPQNLCT